MMIISRPPQAKPRWVAYKNDGDILASAHLLLKPTGFEIKNGQYIIKMDPEHVSNWDGKPKFYINGPTDVPAGGYGLCTEDYPAKVSYYDSNSPYVEPWPGQEVGPYGNSFGPTGTGFQVLGQAYLYGGLNNRSIIYVSRVEEKTYSHLDLLELTGSYTFSTTNTKIRWTSEAYERGDHALSSPTPDTIEIGTDGLYEIHAMGTFKCATAGRTVTLRLYKNGVATNIYAVFVQASTNEEHVHFSGLLDLCPGDDLTLEGKIDTGSATVTVTFARLWFNKVAPPTVACATTTTTTTTTTSSTTSTAAPPP